MFHHNYKEIFIVYCGFKIRLILPYENFQKGLFQELLSEDNTIHCTIHLIPTQSLSEIYEDKELEFSRKFLTLALNEKLKHFSPNDTIDLKRNWKIILKNFPVFIVYRDKGREIYRYYLPIDELKLKTSLLKSKLEKLFDIAKEVWLIHSKGGKIHSSAVQRNNNAFLFLGKSGSGKSTAAFLSKKHRTSIVNDDQNSLFVDSLNNYRICGFNNFSCSYPLKSVFYLMKDTNDYLIQITELKLAKFIFEGFLQNNKENSPFVDDIILQLFKNACQLSHSVPGYELHFKNSADFWKLIEKEFNL